MATQAAVSQRYVVEQYSSQGAWRFRVIDSHQAQSGKYVMDGITSRKTADETVAELNSNFRGQFAFLEGMVNRFIDSYVEKYPQPWSTQSAGVGVDILAADGTHLVNVLDYVQAGWLIDRAKQVELSRFPDGRS